jgi:Putative collagen-binding domain of a collagenase
MVEDHSHSNRAISFAFATALYSPNRCSGLGMWRRTGVWIFLCAMFELMAQGASSLGPASSSGPIVAPLRAYSMSSNLFSDANGKVVYLMGSHTWNAFQDWGTNDSPVPFDFDAYVKMLAVHNHNFTLLWQTELPRFCGLPTTPSAPPDFTVAPLPWHRTGPGNATDGKLKFDFTKFDQAYFDRLRDRISKLGAAGIYAGVYFFSGEFLLRFRCPGDGYPFTGSNNVNGIDDGGGTGSVTMTAPNAITAIQDALVKKIIDTLNDLPNVLWIVSEEAPVQSKWWNNHLIAFVRSYEATKPAQHPIGYGVLDDFNDAVLVDSDADWIAPAARFPQSRLRDFVDRRVANDAMRRLIDKWLPTANCGKGRPACKVIINDSDHSYFGMWNDSAQVNRNFFWINFTAGNQTIFMDPYVVFYPRENRNLCLSPHRGICSEPDSRWDNVRDTIGFIRYYAERMNLAAMTAQGALSSTGHVLANTNPLSAEFLVYSPDGSSFTVNLSGNEGQFAVEWMNPATGVRVAGQIVRGGAPRTFQPPFSGDAVLHLAMMANAPVTPKVDSSGKDH